MKYLALTFLLVLLGACSSTNITYDYDPGVDYTNYATYGFFQGMNTGLAPLDEKRLFRVLERELQRKGFKFSEDPDLMIDITSDTYVYESNSMGGLGMDVGGTGGAMGGGVSLGLPVNGTSLRRTILFNLVDAKRDYLIWKATANGPIRERITPEKKEKKMEQLVAKALSKYPPKIGKRERKQAAQE
ncbi:DUF4136 domain-containing protein [Maribacter sp. 2307ULW6-5]|uniref:DUF4136 domain-containing protein n=1 Tax=Maribacter sp. 2307ULW6-5 TaxID=3386275 RepID=UPI0039BD32D2